MFSEDDLKLSGVHIVQWGYQEFKLFRGSVWSSHCVVGWSGFKLFREDGVQIVQWVIVNIVQWGYKELTLLSELSGVNIVQWGDLEFTLFSGMVSS